MAAQVLDETYSKCFAGRRVLVTGAGKGEKGDNKYYNVGNLNDMALGLGYAIVKKFSSYGAIVFALDKNKQNLEILKSEFRNVTTIVADLRDWDETKRLVKSIAPIDHLVNNAAISQTSYFEEVVPEQIDM